MESLALLGLFTREAASDVNNPGSRDAIEAMHESAVKMEAERSMSLKEDLDHFLTATRGEVEEALVLWIEQVHSCVC